eukprot:7381127-Prymnesium_polylepis.1
MPPSTIYVASRLRKALAFSLYPLIKPGHTLQAGDLPVVLELELGANCRIGPDPDYCLTGPRVISSRLEGATRPLGQSIYTAWHEDAELAQCTFDVHGSAGILLHDSHFASVPASWVVATHLPTAGALGGLDEDDVKEIVLSVICHNFNIDSMADEDSFGVTALQERWLKRTPGALSQRWHSAHQKPWLGPWEPSNFQQIFVKEMMSGIGDLPLVADLIQRAGGDQMKLDADKRLRALKKAKQYEFDVDDILDRIQDRTMTMQERS